MHTWNPSLYLRHGSPRLRPALDLLAQTVQATSVKRVLDYGCGPGNITPYIMKQYPGAFVHGIDSSTNMINTAKTTFCKEFDASFEVASMENFALKALPDEDRYDVIYSNAALHWLPNHVDVMKLLITNALSNGEKGGILAVSMPGKPSINWQQYLPLTGPEMMLQIQRINCPTH